MCRKVTVTMIPKMKSCVDALKAGVREIDIVDGTKKGILKNLLQGKKTGTKIIKK